MAGRPGPVLDDARIWRRGITIENILNPVFITDDSGRFTFICLNVVSILGYSEEGIRKDYPVLLCGS